MFRAQDPPLIHCRLKILKPLYLISNPSAPLDMWLDIQKCVEQQSNSVPAHCVLGNYQICGFPAKPANCKIRTTASFTERKYRN